MEESEEERADGDLREGEAPGSVCRRTPRERLAPRPGDLNHRVRQASHLEAVEDDAGYGRRPRFGRRRLRRNAKGRESAQKSNRQHPKSHHASIRVKSSPANTLRGDAGAK